MLERLRNRNFLCVIRTLSLTEFLTYFRSKYLVFVTDTSTGIRFVTDLCPFIIPLRNHMHILSQISKHELSNRSGYRERSI